MSDQTAYENDARNAIHAGTAIPVPQPRTSPEKGADKRDPLTVPAEYTRDVDMERHTREQVHGSETDVQQETKTDDKLNGRYDNRVMTLVNGAIKAREARENERANLRNRNRLLILMVVLIMELVVPTLYGWHLLPYFFLKYEVLAITLPDALLTVYAFWRKY